MVRGTEARGTHLCTIDAIDGLEGPDDIALSEDRGCEHHGAQDPASARGRQPVHVPVDTLLPPDVTGEAGPKTPLCGTGVHVDPPGESTQVQGTDLHLHLLLYVEEERVGSRPVNSQVTLSHEVRACMRVPGDRGCGPGAVQRAQTFYRAHTMPGS